MAKEVTLSVGGLGKFLETTRGGRSFSRQVEQDVSPTPSEDLLTNEEKKQLYETIQALRTQFPLCIEGIEVRSSHIISNPVHGLVKRESRIPKRYLTHLATLLGLKEQDLFLGKAIVQDRALVGVAKAKATENGLLLVHPASLTGWRNNVWEETEVYE